ncbi:hypothetical protein AHAS_Ahas10G0144400 [Arachis hypogaea]
MRNSDRIELSIDPGTWNPMDEDMVSMDPIEFHSEEESESCAAVAAESSTGTWTTVWTDGLTSLDRYKGRCYNIEPVAGEENQYIAYLSIPARVWKGVSLASGTGTQGLLGNQIPKP